MTTSGSNRTLFIVLGVVGGLLVLLVLLGYVWWQRTGSAVVRAATASYQQGRELGHSLTAEACVDSVMAHHAAVASGQSFTDMVGERVFFDGCLTTSQPSAGLCDTIPARGDVMQGVRWATEQCRLRRLGDSQCPQLLLTPLQQHCARRLPRG